MTKKELSEAVSKVKADNKEALEALFNALSDSAKVEMLLNETIKKLLERYIND